MSDTPNSSDLAALQQQFAAADINANKRNVDANAPLLETTKMRKSQGLNSVSNTRTIRVNDESMPKDADGKSTLLYTISVTITSSMDDRDDDLDSMQKAVTDFVKNIHNHI